MENLFTLQNTSPFCSRISCSELRFATSKLTKIELMKKVRNKILLYCIGQTFTLLFTGRIIDRICYVHQWMG